MKYIVTGGAGFIGSHIVEYLVENHHEVVVIDDLSTGRIENINRFIKDKKITFIQGSVTDLALLKKIFVKADGVFHHAALVSVQGSIDDPELSHAVTLTGTLNVLLAAREAEVRKIVTASSAALYGNLPGLPKHENMDVDPLSPYAVEKHAAEEYSRVFSSLYGLQTVCLRYFNVFGLRQNPNSDYAAVIPKFIDQIFKNKPLRIYGDGEQTRDFIYVKDVVQANIKAMQSDAQGVFNIANGIETSVNDLARIILRVFSNSMNPEYLDARSGEVKYSVADISKAKRELQFTPEYTLERGLEEMKKAIV